jgi:hypothetical protein
MDQAERRTGRSRDNLIVAGMIVPRAASIVERTIPMADEEQGPPAALPRLVQEFISQFREATERWQGLAGLGGRLPSAPGAFPLPGAMSAAELTSIADSIAAQRRSIQALQAQLSAFDEQLAALEQILGPLAEWSKTWAEFEQRLLNLGRAPEAES